MPAFSVAFAVAVRHSATFIRPSARYNRDQEYNNQARYQFLRRLSAFSGVFMTYRPPVRDMAYTLNEVAGLSGLLGSGSFEELSADLVSSVMEEGAKLAADVLAPLNRSGDAEGAKLGEKGVSVPAGFADAYKKWVEGGWGSIAATPDFGGQGLPVALSVAMQEMWNAACMSFGLCPILSQGAIEALTAHGTPEQKKRYLP